MEVKYVKYYKLLVHISSPTYFFECSPYSKRRHKGIYTCANSFCHCLLEDSEQLPQHAGGVYVQATCKILNI